MTTFLLYPILLISKLCKKNFSSIGKILKLTGNTVLNKIIKSVTIEEFSLKIVNKMFENRKKIKILVDDTLIKKFFSNKIEGTSFLYDHVLKIFGKYICLMTVILSDDKNTLPLKYKICTSKDLDPEGHLNKNEIFRNIILETINLGISDHVVADGFFATEKNLIFFNKNNIKFDMRFPCNRKIILDGETESKRVDKCFNFKLKKKFINQKLFVVYIKKMFFM